MGTTRRDHLDALLATYPADTISARRMRHHRDQILDTLKLCTDHVFDEFERRCAEPQGHDGYPASSGAGGTGTGGDVSRPTEQVVVDQYPTLDNDGNIVARGWSPDTDGQLAAIRRAQQALSAGADLARILEQTVGFVRHVSAQAHRTPGSAPGSGDCLACESYVSGVGDDRLRGGFCDACRKAHARWRANGGDGGVTDRARFIFGRRAQLAGVAAARAQADGRTLSGQNPADEIGKLQDAGILPAARDAS